MNLFFQDGHRLLQLVTSEHTQIRVLIHFFFKFYISHFVILTKGGHRVCMICIVQLEPIFEGHLTNTLMGTEC